MHNLKKIRCWYFIKFWKSVNARRHSSYMVLITMLLGTLLATFVVEAYAIPATDAVFTDVTNSAGVAFSGAQFGTSWGDYNNDGWLDLVVINHFHDDLNLYLNNGNVGTFTDMYASSNIIPPLDRHGVSWGDYDNDGDLDLYMVTKQGRENGLMENQGAGTFVDQATAAGVLDLPGRGRTASWVDYDSDGKLDLFVGNEIKSGGPDRLFKNNGNGTFSDVTNTSGISETYGTWGNVWGDYNNDGHMDLVLTGGERVALYRNNGDGTFTRANTEAGIYEDDIRSWGADFGDYDNDGDLDLYIARGNYIFGDHLDVSSSAVTYTFGASGEEDGFDFQSSTSQVTFDTLTGDGPPMYVGQIYIGASGSNPAAVPFTLGTGIIDQCGQPAYTPGTNVGVFIWQDCPGSTWHLRGSNVWELQGQVTTSGSFSNVTEVGLEPLNKPPKLNQLFKNQNGTFVEVGAAAGVASASESQSATWGDYNNDGLLDLYVANSGSVEVGNQANHLYRNKGDGTFEDVALAAGVQALTAGFGDCATWADYDRDGFLDLFVTTEGHSGYFSGPHKLYHNQGNSNNWLEIDLTSTISNRFGIGARVEVLAGGGVQMRQMNNGSHHLCQNSPRLHFGLGDITFIQAITVTWPSGNVQVLNNQFVNQILTIEEGQTSSPPGGDNKVYLPLIAK